MGTIRCRFRTAIAAMSEEFLDCARVSRFGFGVSPKQACLGATI
jgi:hypothetical protein